MESEDKWQTDASLSFTEWWIMHIYRLILPMFILMHHLLINTKVEIKLKTTPDNDKKKTYEREKP